jgi:hypothetical protein
MGDHAIEPDDGWLENINEEFRAREIPHAQRPWEAWREWSMQLGISTSMGDPSVKRIFEWFKENTKDGSQNIGSMYVGTFYYDACFWPVTVPLVFGTVKLVAQNSLATMPSPIRNSLFRNVAARDLFIKTWSECLDYGLGIGEVLAENDTSFFQQLLRSADGQLNATATLLHEPRPNPKALESARMATEMFLKAYLARNVALTDDDARRTLGHNLERVVHRIIHHDNVSELAVILGDLHIFPDVGDRYQGTARSSAELWQGYQIAQFVGATLVRTCSGRDSRTSIRR